MKEIRDEVGQALIRFFLVLGITIYSLSYSYFIIGTIESYLYLLMSFIIISLAEIYFANHVINLSEGNSYRIIFRAFTNIIDNLLLAIALVVMGKVGAPLFFIYLWITFGIGIRYGVNYLIFSASLNIISYSAVIYVAPFWHSNDTILISFGLLTSLIILPIYVYYLISKLTKALEAEKAARQSKQIFLANINHDLKTPLNSIVNLIEAAQIKLLPNQIYKTLSMICISAKSQIQIIDSMLDLSKIESCREIQKNRFDLYFMLYEIQQIILPHVLSKEINFNVYIDPKCSQYLIGASNQIKQVLINLSDNAVKYTKSGIVKLSVHSEERFKSGERLKFEVSDTGIGIPLSLHKYLYKPFSQIDSSYGGIGLGLSISDELLKMMGGKLFLTSEKDKGTSFSFLLFFKTTAPNEEKLVEKDSRLTLLPLNLTNKHSGIMSQYKKKGIQINAQRVNFNHDIIINTMNFIAIYDEDMPVTKATNHILLNTDIPKISINRQSQSLKISNTSISLNSDSFEFINTINICKAFLNINLFNKFSYTESNQVLNILIAEDDLITKELINQIFLNAGHSVTSTENGQEALKLLNNNKYDVAILDLRLPDVSGIEVSQKYNVGTCKNKTPLVLLTADINYITPEQAACFSLVLLKSMPPRSLLKEIYRTVAINKNNLNVNEIYHIDTDCSLINISMVESNVLVAGSDRYAHVLEVYDEEIKNNLMKLQSTKDSNMIEKLNILHRIKGASNTIGAIEFGNKINDLINYLSSGDECIFNTETNYPLFTLHEKTISKFKSYLRIRDIYDKHVG